MKALFNIGMFFASPLLIYIIHIYSVRRIGAWEGYSNCRKCLTFLLYLLSINICTFLVSYARGVKSFHFEQMTVSYRLKYIGLGFAFGLFFVWAVLQMSKPTAQSTQKRNYELDFLKLFFAICVFIWHTDSFRNENTKVVFPLQLATIPIHFFFVVSGMLMVNSILKKDMTTTEYGNLAVLFVIHRFKTLAWDVYAALFVFMSVYVFTIPSEQIPGTLVRSIPELLFVTRSGINLAYNDVDWYLSAMFLCMLPISYLLYKKRDLTMHILAPLFAVFTLGYFCQIHEYCFLPNEGMYGLFMGGIYRAVCGLCFGICAYNMYIRFSRADMNENMRMLLTIAEIFLYGIFFGTWFLIRDNKALMSVVFLLPIAIAITFSGKSYLVRLFQFEWMKYFASVSLTVYLNHWIGRVLVQKYFEGNSYGFCVSMMAFFTLCSCLLSTVTIRIGKCIWNNKLKRMF